MAGYAGLSLALVAAGTFLALRLRPSLARPEALWGASAAWVLQAIAFAALYRALARGGSAVGAWVAGIGARVGGLALAFVVVAMGPVRPALGIVFGLSLLGLLLLESAWLALDGPRPAAARGGERPRPPDDAAEDGRAAGEREGDG